MKNIKKVLVVSLLIVIFIFISYINIKITKEAREQCIINNGYQCSNL